MPDKGASPKGLTPATSPRGNVTPSGHKNVRVFVSTNLHFRLLANSAASEMSLNDFVVAWLERATPLKPESSPLGGTTTPATLPATVASQGPPSGPGGANDNRPFHAEISPKAAGHGQVPNLTTSDSLATNPDTSPAHSLTHDPAPAEGGSRA